MSASNMLADRDEDFNTRLGSMRGWQMAIERVVPIPRDTVQLSLYSQITRHELATPEEVVDFWQEQYFSVRLQKSDKAALANRLREELGTSDIQSASSYAEEGLRKVLHLMLSLPEYQLG
jgi:hypothetical protein